MDEFLVNQEYPMDSEPRRHLLAAGLGEIPEVGGMTFWFTRVRPEVPPPRARWWTWVGKDLLHLAQWEWLYFRHSVSRSCGLIHRGRDAQALMTEPQSVEWPRPMLWPISCFSR